ncbi:DeoR/GlpR family DNA-binding transcription regulator [Microlunatus soli]|uniref:Lactose phosphotransferase system repressor n=1 Tax=Microlunatus soli TaxID=630515 RepID=A0A1H1YCD0_9ACTN|nr:DeoR/GlpR family DNA-binding transcription regulator [Microlunatus soli]SDT19103.1 transcriptional regulator, DeoR family [Microlunatus soli]
MPAAGDDGQRQLPAGRKARLLAHLDEVGQVTVGSLAERFGVSIDTIRRDLDRLSADGRLVRTYGGAVSSAAARQLDRAVDVRLTEQEAEKGRIAEVAARLVDNGSTIIMNGGTTVLAVARALRDHHDLTVATNNLLVPPAFGSSVVREVYMFGGAVRATTLATIGPVSFRDAGGNELDINGDLALIGVGAVSADAGFTTSNLAEAAMMREMMNCAERVAVLADAQKFGRRLFAKISDLAAADYLVTDAPPAPPLAEALDAAGVEVLLPD